MSTINCIIIDDEPLARKGLKEYVEDVEFLHFSGEFDHPLKASQLINEGSIHLLFLDIQMPKISGIEFFKTLSNAPPVIFTTAFPQYALDGFELNALDYLVKPISFDRFYKAALRAKDYYEVRTENSKTSFMENDDHFFIKSDNKLVKISLNEILFVEALQNYVSIQTISKKYITYLTFRTVEEYLPANRFIKTHKSYIVAAGKISSIEGSEIRVDSYSIPISRNSREEVMDKLLKGKFLKR
jgi:DNA-binding LytR/AlgR family response regulator